MSTIERKTFSGAFELKDEATGEVSATVATFDVVDKEGDMIRMGAVKDGAKVVMSSYAHNVVVDGAEPVGRGTLKTVGNRLQFDGRLFLATTRGRETYEILKEMGELQQWSFAFRIAREDAVTPSERKAGARRALALIHPAEVAPVFEGAGIGTATLAVKAAAAAVEAVDAAENEWLKSLYDRYVLPLERSQSEPFELRGFLDRHRTRDKQIEQSFLQEIAAKVLDRELTRPDAYEAPADFDRVVNFARASLELNYRALPSPRLVRPGTLVRDGKRLSGVFRTLTGGAPKIFLEDTGDMAGMTKTFFHEAEHARQHHYGDPFTEDDACEQADVLFAAWQRREQEG